MSLHCPHGKRLFTYAGYVMQTNCGSWNCPYCRKQLAHYWARNVAYGWALWKPRPFYFLTLTMPGWMNNPVDGYRCLPAAFDKWRSIVKRLTGWFVYAAFAEEQHVNRDMVHLHIITLSNLPTRLNDLAVACGFGFEARNMLVSGTNAVYYVAKYASKQLPHAPHHFRRVRISQNWPRLPDPILPKDYISQRQREPIRDYIMRCSAELGISTAQLTDLYDNWATDIQS